MTQIKGSLLSGIVALALMWATNASAIPTYNLVTDFGVTGQISFSVADNFVGTIDASDVASFSWYSNVIGSLVPEDPNAWFFRNDYDLIGTINGLTASAEVRFVSYNSTNLYATLIIDTASTSSFPGAYNYYNPVEFSGNVWLQAIEATVPAPAALALLSMGLVGVGAATKRRNRKH
jgi:hypothetical protein